jgi:leader peptidase (prepilin peptidase) / N-methyltransferase
MNVIGALRGVLHRAGLAGRFEVRRWEVLACATFGVVLSLLLLPYVPTIAAIASGYLAATMLLVTIIDSRHLIIPDALSLPAIPLGLVAASAALSGPWTEIVADRIEAAAIAGATLLAIRWAYFRLRGAIGLGLGDVKLAAAAGAWVGLDLLALTCLLATCAALSAIVVRKLVYPAENTAMSSAIPFGSFIAPAIVIVWLSVLFNL